MRRERNTDQDFIILEKEPALVKTESKDLFIGGGVVDKSQHLVLNDNHFAVQDQKVSEIISFDP